MSLNLDFSENTYSDKLNNAINAARKSSKLVRETKIAADDAAKHICNINEDDSFSLDEVIKKVNDASRALQKEKNDYIFLFRLNADINIDYFSKKLEKAAINTKAANHAFNTAKINMKNIIHKYNMVKDAYIKSFDVAYASYSSRDKALCFFRNTADIESEKCFAYSENEKTKIALSKAKAFEDDVMKKLSYTKSIIENIYNSENCEKIMISYSAFIIANRESSRIASSTVKVFTNNYLSWCVYRTLGDSIIGANSLKYKDWCEYRSERDSFMRLYLPYIQDNATFEIAACDINIDLHTALVNYDNAMRASQVYETIHAATKISWDSYIELCEYSGIKVQLDKYP